MAKPRKKWRVEPSPMTVGPPSYAPHDYPSENKAYEYVRRIFDNPGDVTRIVVYVDERAGRGWETFEIHEKGVDF